MQADPRLESVMTRYAAGDDGAFDELYRLLSPRLYGFCWRLCRGQALADDLLQETLLKLHRYRASYQVGASVLTWCYAIARSTYLDLVRYQRRRPEVLAETEEGALTYPASGLPDGIAVAAASPGDPESEAMFRQTVSIVNRVLANLPENQRAAYVLLREEGLSVAEAALVLGATASATKLRAHRAYEAIREALRAAGLALVADRAQDRGDL